jgi:hypothetical protein
VKTSLALAPLLCLCACITQRSLSFGQLAAPMGTGGAEVAVTTGVMYGQESAPSTQGTDGAGNPTTSQMTGDQKAFPWFEANAQYGFSRQVALNVHASPAGLQPGVKWTLNRSSVANIAVLPEVGFGYEEHTSQNLIADASGAQQAYTPNATNNTLFQAGLKILISHQSGFYGGIGYDFLYVRTKVDAKTGTPNSQTDTTDYYSSTQHQLAAAVGFSAKVGMISIRPELAFAIVPSISGSHSQVVNNMGTLAESGGGGFAWAILPSFAFALTTPANEKVEVEEKPTTDPDEREGKDEDEDDRAKQRRRPSGDDDD